MQGRWEVGPDATLIGICSASALFFTVAVSYSRRLSSSMLRATTAYFSPPPKEYPYSTSRSTPESAERHKELRSDLYGHFAASFLMVLVLRIVKGSLSTLASGTVENSDVPVFLRRHQ